MQVLKTESAHHRCVTGGLEARGQETRRQRKPWWIFKQIHIFKCGSNITKAQQGFFLICHHFGFHRCVWAAVNISSVPWWGERDPLLPGTEKTSFLYVNAAEWHTTKVGCAAALSLLNGMLAFSFTRVTGTCTSQVFAPKMCVEVCVRPRWCQGFLSVPGNRK